MIFHSHANKTHLHKKGCALGLIFKVRVFGTRKCLIWRSFDPVWRFFFYDLCVWSDCPPSWIIMSSVINWGSPPHKGRKLRWGSVADPGEGYPPPLFKGLDDRPHHPPPPPLPPLSQGLDPALRLNAGELRRLQNDSSLKLQESLSLISFFVCVVKRTTKLFI